METGEIPDSQITASNAYSPASLARINGRFAWHGVLRQKELMNTFRLERKQCSMFWRFNLIDKRKVPIHVFILL